LRARTYPLTLEETKAYIQQRLRIAGSNGNPIFDPEALVAVHRYSNGIPRVINLLCEHCLVSSFVDQQKLILPQVVETVARDFDMGDSVTSGPSNVSAPPVSAPGAEKFDLVEALRSLATLADRLRQPEEQEKDLPKEGKL
jgi:hypothetical protein